MSDPHILVIEHQHQVGLGQLEAVLVGQGMRLTTAGPECDIAVPAVLDGYDALIVLGGFMGPADDEAAPWLPRTRELLCQAVEVELPTLGICLGAQLLAAATGGYVNRMPAGPEVGLSEVSFSDSASTDPLFAGFAGNTVATVQWHWLEAARLPESACVLASSDACENQAFRIGPAAWGVQFHPEALSATAQEWADKDSDNLREIGLDATALVQTVHAAEPELRRSWAVVGERFAQIVRAKKLAV